LLKTIREIIGPKRIMLICATQWRAMGYGDTCRTGTDVQPHRLKEGVISFLNALRATFSNYWMHTVIWYCDPDVIIVRQELPFEAAKVWASLLGLSGQVLMISDNMLELSEERIELLKRILPPQPIRPMDLFPRKPEPPYPQIWDLKIATNWGKWDIVGVFRWFEDDPAEVIITREKLGLPEGRYVIYDVWEKKFIGELGDKLILKLEPETCKVLCIRMLEGIPLFLGTNRHITQGYPDVLKLKWNKERNIVKGESLLVKDDPYEIRFLIEWDNERYKCKEVKATSTSFKWEENEKLLVITLKNKVSSKVNWQVSFRRRH